MTRQLPADKATHAVLGALIALAALPAGAVAAAVLCAVAAVGREVYGAHARGWRMNRAQAVEHAQDIGATLAGGAVVLVAAFIGAGP